MTFSVLCESPRERHLRRSVPRSVFAAMSLSAFIYFLTYMNRGFEILFARFEIRRFICMCGRAAKAPDCKSGGHDVLRGCESYHMHQSLRGCRLNWQTAGLQNRNSQFESEHPCQSNSWKGSLTGKAVVLKTTARLSLAGSSPVPSANFTDL